MAETMAPDFVTPPKGVHRFPVSSIVPTGRPLDEGIKLFLNKDLEGFVLEPESEGLWLSPVENTVVPRATGGGSLRNRRWADGDSFLVISLHSPSPEHMYDMFAMLVEVVTGQGDYFDLVVFDPYSQEARRRTFLYESGLENLGEVTGTYHRVGVTAKFLSPFWRGPERVVTERIAPPVKPLITADPGSPVNRWDDPEFADSTAYEPWFVVDGGLEKQGTGGEHGVFASGHRVAVNPGETVSVSAGLSYVDGPNVGDIQVRVRAYDDTSTLVSGSEQTVISESYGGTYTGTYVVPETGAEIELGFYTASDVHANTRVRIDNLDVKRDVQYLARYEWEGEPHNSPSIKRDHTGKIVAWNPLSGVDREFDKIWVQATPPPPGTSYEWAGQYAVKKQDGEELVRNWFSYEYLADRSNWVLGVYSRTPVFQLEPNTEYTFHAKLVKEHSEGEWGVFNISEGWATRYQDGQLRIVYNQSGPKPELEDLTVTFTTPEDGQIRFFYYDKHAGNSPEGQWITDKLVEAQIVRSDLIGDYFDGDTASDRANDLWYNDQGVPHGWVDGQGWTVLNDPGFGPVPEGFMSLPVEVGFDGDTPAKVDEGSREGSYSYPFFPVFLADSTVQGEHELRVEGDAPVWPIWEIQGPGRDVEIIGPCGGRLFVEGEVTTPITIVTEPGKRSIRDASGLIWDRMKPGDDQFFALEPGEQTIKMTMVGGNPESTIRAVYSENWKTPRGTAQAMIGGG